MTKKKTHRSGARLPRDHHSTHSNGGNETGETGHRQERLEKILYDELQTILREAADPALAGILLVTVQLAPDGGHARIGYAALAPLAEEEHAARTTREALARATGFLRARLSSLLELKRLPKLTFTFVGAREPGARAPREGGEPWQD
jgi:ribosome-binding factor A